MIKFIIREIAQEKGISQNMLSHRAQLDVKTIQRLYRESHPDVSIYTLEKIADALGVKVKDLFVEVEDEQG